MGHVDSLSNKLQSFAQHFIPQRTITRNYILLTLQEVWSIETHWVLSVTRGCIAFCKITIV